MQTLDAAFVELTISYLSKFPSQFDHDELVQAFWFVNSTFLLFDSIEKRYCFRPPKVVQWEC